MRKVATPSKTIELLSVEELAEVLKVPATTIYKWRMRGQGPPSIRVGRYVRFDVTDVASWLEARKSKPVAVVPQWR